MPETKIPLSAGAILPRDMNQRQWGEWARAQSTRNIRSGATGYNVGEGVWFGADTDGIIKLSIGDSAGNKITWDGTTLTVIGNITVDDGSITAPKLDVDELSAITADMGTLTAGVINLTDAASNIHSGQTAYDTGTGFWLERNSGTPRFSIGNSAGNKLTWNGSVLAVTGSLNFTNSVQTFTPTWTGFSSDPSGDISYLDFGAYVVMYRDTALTGTSNATGMTITNLPAAITPSGNRVVIGTVTDNSSIFLGSVTVGSGGTLQFGKSTVGTSVQFDGSGFTNSGTKGLPTGWIITYAK